MAGQGVLPTAVTPENAPLWDRDDDFQEFLRSFEIASLISEKLQEIKSCPVENIILLTVALLFWSILWIIGAVCEFFPLQKNFIWLVLNSILSFSEKCKNQGSLYKRLIINKVLFFVPNLRMGEDKKTDLTNLRLLLQSTQLIFCWLYIMLPWKK